MPRRSLPCSTGCFTTVTCSSAAPGAGAPKSTCRKHPRQGKNYLCPNSSSGRFCPGHGWPVLTWPLRQKGQKPIPLYVYCTVIFSWIGQLIPPFFPVVFVHDHVF